MKTAPLVPSLKYFIRLNLRRLIPFRLYARYLANWKTYSAQAGAEPLHWQDRYPCLFDRTETTPFDPHYFYQSLWAFQKILDAKPDSHLDVGSAINFVGLVAAVTRVTFIDIRPVLVEWETFRPVAGNLTVLPLRGNSIKSLSCLHVAEHVGLGRYGDPLDPHGTRNAAAELKRVLCPGGNLYFSLPVGRARVCFDAHRIHAPSQILEYFDGLHLEDFALVDDAGQFYPGANPSDAADASYACGLFHFTKPEL